MSFKRSFAISYSLSVLFLSLVATTGFAQQGKVNLGSNSAHNRLHRLQSQQQKFQYNKNAAMMTQADLEPVLIANRNSTLALRPIVRNLGGVDSRMSVARMRIDVVAAGRQTSYPIQSRTINGIPARHSIAVQQLWPASLAMKSRTLPEGSVVRATFSVQVLDQNRDNNLIVRYYVKSRGIWVQQMNMPNAGQTLRIANQRNRTVQHGSFSVQGQKLNPKSARGSVQLNPQPEPPGKAEKVRKLLQQNPSSKSSRGSVKLNPQPEPPGMHEKIVKLYQQRPSSKSAQGTVKLKQQSDSSAVYKKIHKLYRKK